MESWSNGVMQGCSEFAFNCAITPLLQHSMKFLQSLAQQFTAKPIDWDELEESLIRADLGVPMTMRILKRLQEREAWSVTGLTEIERVVREEIALVLPVDAPPIRPLPAKPKVILLVGVNGTGKTTS